MKSKLICFSPDGEKLAHCGPDGVLRIWDSSSGGMEHEYKPAKHLKAATNCIKYSPKMTKGSYSLLAMGTLAGTVLLYSPEDAGVKATLEHSSNQPIMDVAWVNATCLLSLSKDNTLVKWTLSSEGKGIEKQVFEEVCEGTAICSMGKKTVVIGNRKIQVVIAKESGKMIAKANLTGHLSPITQLLNIRRKGGGEGFNFLSSSIDDRFIYAWSTVSSSEGPLCSFMVKDSITSMACGRAVDNTITVAATTAKGALVLFKHHLNGNAGGIAVKGTGSLHIYTNSDKKTVIPIVAAHFCSDETNIIIVYSRSSIFTFEQLSIDEIVETQELVRAETSLSKDLGLMKTITPTIPDDAVMVEAVNVEDTIKKSQAKRKRGDEDNVASLPMEERLNVLAMDSSGSQQGKAILGTEDYAQLLLQGLHSKDQSILRSVFDRGDMKSIHQTVSRLPVQAVVPLLEQLAQAIMGKGPKNASYVKWVRSVLYNHMSHLTTVPDRQELIQPFLNISAARMSTFAQVTQLHSRLDLLLTHVATKQEDHKQRDPDALLVYKDESSDEDDIMGPMIGISESEDNWDELSDVGDENDESEMEVDQSLGASKRQLRTNKDVNGEEIDNDDVEDIDDDDDDEESDDSENDDDDEEEEENSNTEESDDGNNEFIKMNGDIDGESTD